MRKFTFVLLLSGIIAGLAACSGIGASSPSAGALSLPIAPNETGADPRPHMLHPDGGSGGGIAVGITYETNPISVGGPGTAMEVLLTNKSSTQAAVNGLSFSMTLPMASGGGQLNVMQNMPIKTSCNGGTVAATQTTVALAGVASGSLQYGASCWVGFWVNSSSIGEYTTTIPSGAVVTTQGVTNNIGAIAVAANPPLVVNSGPFLPTGHLYVPSPLNEEVDVFAIGSSTPQYTISKNLEEPSIAAVDPWNGTVYVFDEKTDIISVFSQAEATTDEAASATIHLSRAAFGMTVDPEHHLVVVTGNEALWYNADGSLAAPPVVSPPTASWTTVASNDSSDTFIGDESGAQVLDYVALGPVPTQATSPKCTWSVSSVIADPVKAPVVPVTQGQFFLGAVGRDVYVATSHAGAVPVLNTFEEEWGEVASMYACSTTLTGDLQAPDNGGYTGLTVIRGIAVDANSGDVGVSTTPNWNDVVAAKFQSSVDVWSNGPTKPTNTSAPNAGKYGYPWVSVGNQVGQASYGP